MIRSFGMPIRSVAASTSVEAQRSNSLACSGSPESPTITAMWTVCAATGAASTTSSDANANPFVSSWTIGSIASTPTLNSSVPLCEADGAAIAPFRAQQSDEEHQHNRHVPQLAFFDRRHSAARVTKVVGHRVDCLRGIETATGVFGDALQPLRVHGRIEVLG